MRCRALLFDLDGVLVDSRECIERIWRDWAALRGVDPDTVIRASQGRRTSDTLREIAPHLDVDAEVAVVDEMEEHETFGLRAAPGAAAILSRLAPGQWAIVTSGSRRVATMRLTLTSLPIPSVFVTGDQVQRGKPDPEGYLGAAAALRVVPADAVVLEDAPAGVAAARAAGMRVVGIATTHEPAAISAADLIVPDLSALRIETAKGGWIEILHGTETR